MGKDYSNLKEAIRYCCGIGSCENCPQDFQCNGTSGSWYMLRLIADALDELDKRVEVVRCGQCKHCVEHYDTDGNAPYWTCKEWDSGTDYDGYCHYGERKDGGQDE